MIRLLIGLVLIVLFFVSTFAIPQLVQIKAPLAEIVYYLYCVVGGLTAGVFISTTFDMREQ